MNDKHSRVALDIDITNEINSFRDSLKLKDIEVGAVFVRRIGVLGEVSLLIPDEISGSGLDCLIRDLKEVLALMKDKMVN